VVIYAIQSRRLGSGGSKKSVSLLGLVQIPSSRIRTSILKGSSHAEGIKAGRTRNLGGHLRCEFKRSLEYKLYPFVKKIRSSASQIDMEPKFLLTDIAAPVEVALKVGWAVNSPMSVLGSADRIRPLSHASFFAREDFLTFAYEPHKHAPIRYPIADFDQQVRLRAADVLLVVHETAIPGSLRFVKDDDLLSGLFLIDSVLLDELVEVLDEDPAT